MTSVFYVHQPLQTSHDNEFISSSIIRKEFSMSGEAEDSGDSACPANRTPQISHARASRFALVAARAPLFISNSDGLHGSL